MDRVFADNVEPNIRNVRDVTLMSVYHAFLRFIFKTRPVKAVRNMTQTVYYVTFIFVLTV